MLSLPTRVRASRLRHIRRDRIPWGLGLRDSGSAVWPIRPRSQRSNRSITAPRALGRTRCQSSDTRRKRAGDGSAQAVSDLAAPAIVKVDPELNAPELFLNRELTWLAFNRRVFEEALDERNPLLERVKFLAITASNLDEFFMKRIGGLKQQVVAGVHELTVDGRTPHQQIAECYARRARNRARAARSCCRCCSTELARIQHRVIGYGSNSSPTSRSAIARILLSRNIFPLMTPLAMDPAHPFPFVSNLSLNLLVTMRDPGETETSMARVKVPVGAGIPRFMRVDGTENASCARRRDGAQRSTCCSPVW